VPVALSNQEISDVNQHLIIIFDYAKTHNVQALEGMKVEIAKLNNSTLNKAYYLSLYMVAPEKYETLYVDIFPVDTNGIMHDLYENIELKRLTPKFLYSVDAIGAIALKGNKKAIEKVLLGGMHSDGAVSELFCDYTAKLLDKNLLRTLIVLSRVESNERKGIYECFNLMTSEDFLLLKKKINTIKPNYQKVKQVIEEINHIEINNEKQKGS
jgi:hypothetical protein